MRFRSIIYIGIARIRENTQRAVTPLSLDYRQRTDAGISVALSETPRKIARRNHRHQVPRSIFMQIPRCIAAYLLFSACSFASTFLTRVVSRRVVLRATPSRLLSLRWFAQTARISIRRRVSTGFFRMPRGRSEADETRGSNGISSTTFPAFSAPGGRCTRCTGGCYVC